MLDFYDISALFTPEERQTQATLREFLEAEVMPHVRDWWEDGTFPDHLAPRFGEMGLLGASLPGPDHAPSASSVGYGLVMYELERVDSGLRSFASVQGSLVMYPIHSYGSDEQRQRYLPKLAAGEMVGCFGLTEREAGSDPASMTARAKKDGDDYVLSGAKMWISCGAFADVAIVWAKDDEGAVLGFIVPTNSPGFAAHPVQRQMSLRVGGVAELVLDGVRVPQDQVLPGAHGLSAPLSCLTQARYGLAWGAMGALEAVYSEALDFAKTRVTFGKPIAARQLVQEKLVRMLSDHTSGLLLAWRLGPVERRLHLLARYSPPLPPLTNATADRSVHPEPVDPARAKPSGYGRSRPSQHSDAAPRGPSQSQRASRLAGQPAARPCKPGPTTWCTE